MAWSPKAVANYFLSLAERDEKKLSPMKLQKLVYYAHGWHLAILNEPLVNEQVEAWRFGPVISTLYRDLKKYGSRPITDKLRKSRWRGGKCHMFVPVIGNKSDPRHKTRDILEKVWDVYKNYSAVQLSNLAHEPGSPWSEIYRGESSNIPFHTDIPSDKIARYFQSNAVRQ